MMNLEKEAEKIKEIASTLDYLEKTLKREERELNEAEAEVQHSKQAQDILQHLAQAVQQRVHEKVSAVVSSSLEAVFDDPYAFKIQFERKRGRTEASLRFLRRDLDVDPLTATGGGVVDVAAFALRVACLVMHQPKLSRLVVLDEPFKFVSAQYRPKVRQMLEELSKEMGLQIVMVTHIEEFETGKIIEV